MIVADATPYAEIPWTGAETSFNPGVKALSISHVATLYRTSAGSVATLVDGVHLQLLRNVSTGAITATPLAMPPAPGTVIFERTTPDTNTIDFADLAGFSAAAHTAIANAAALRDAEIRRGALADIPPRTGHAGRLLGLDPTLRLAWLDLVSPGELAASAFGEAWLALADAAAGRAYLDAPSLAELAAALALKENSAALAMVARSGAYVDLSGKPSLGTAAAKNFGTSEGQLVELTVGGKLPAVNGSLLTGLTWAPGLLSLSGLSSADIINIPSGLTEIFLTFYGVSLSGTDDINVQIGSSGILSTGYISTGKYNAVYTSSTSAFHIDNLAAANEINGMMRLVKADENNIWTCHCMVSLGGTATYTSAGLISLAATLAAIRVSAAGTNTFDAGNLRIFGKR